VPNRYKLKFSPDKVDTMIVQAIALLDDLDKEINIYSMRVKVRRGRAWKNGSSRCEHRKLISVLSSISSQEWYGWHFPEMAKIISENITYAKIVKAMGRSSPGLLVIVAPD
jgi:nucleolar protein 58